MSGCDWRHAVRGGDRVRPKKLWNQTTIDQRLPDPVTVVKVESHQSSQTGIMWTVMSIKGKELRLDAGWFDELAEVGR